MDHLLFLSGPLEGKAHPLADTQIIGRVQQADLQIEDASVSREHARLARTPDGWLLVDLGSSNGTAVDGTRQQRTLVPAGSVITFGAVHARLVVATVRKEASPQDQRAPDASEVSTRAGSDPTLVLKSLHAEKPRTGFGADDFAQLSPLVKLLWVLGVVAVSAGLFWAAYSLV